MIIIKGQWFYIEYFLQKCFHLPYVSISKTSIFDAGEKMKLWLARMSSSHKCIFQLFDGQFSANYLLFWSLIMDLSKRHSFLHVVQILDMAKESHWKKASRQTVVTGSRNLICILSIFLITKRIAFSSHPSCAAKLRAQVSDRARSLVYCFVYIYSLSGCASGDQRKCSHCVAANSGRCYEGPPGHLHLLRRCCPGHTRAYHNFGIFIAY